MSSKIVDKLNNKKICILGLGIENYALVKFLLKEKISCEITICDKRNKNALKKSYSVIASDYKERSNFGDCFVVANTPPRNDMAINWQLGKNYEKNLDQYNIIFRSPGYPLFNKNLIKAKKTGVEISSPIKLFFQLCPSKNITGITGTKGKGTTAALIYHILKKTGKQVWLGGNIGVAPFSFVDKINKNDWVVLELSSFQLEDMDVSPHIAVITNFSREHLAPVDPHNPNYHKTMKDYWQAKLNIVKWQKTTDKAVLNKNLKARFRNLALKGKKMYFTKSELLSKLIGDHNKENIAAAVEAAKLVGTKENTIKEAVISFKGLEHRLEHVKTVKGVKYYNDSFATTPESTLVALKSFEQPIVLLAGGAEKKSDFKKLVKEIKRRVKFVTLLQGQATSRLKKELLKIGFNKNQIKLVYNIQEAVKQAKKQAILGDIVLLSTACASFGMFKNYKQRGELFKRVVKKL